MHLCSEICAATYFFRPDSLPGWYLQTRDQCEHLQRADWRRRIGGVFDKKDGFRNIRAGSTPTILNKDSDPSLQAMANFSCDDTHLGGGLYNLTGGYFELYTRSSGEMDAAKDYQGVLKIGSGQMSVSGRKVMVDIDRDLAGTSGLNGDDVFNPNKNLGDTVLVDGERDQFRVEIEFYDNLDPTNIGNQFTL